MQASTKQGRSALRAALFLFLTSICAWPQTEAQTRRSQQAKELMAAGRFASAVPIYAELVRELPGNIGLHLNLALAYHMSGQQQAAIPEFERVLKSDPSNIPALLSLGAAQLELNQPAKAVVPLEKFVTLQPSHVESRGMLANALLTLDRPREAAPHFRKLTTQTPNDPKAWYGLGRAYESLAQKAFTELDKNAAGSPEWLVLVADSRRERRQYRSAFYFYHQALEKAPTFRGVHAALAQVYQATDHADWAAAEKGKEAAQPKPNCVREKAECDFAAGRFVEAAAAPSPYWRSRANDELARRAFRQLGALPESVELHALKAEIATEHGQYLEAANEWRAAQKLAPQDSRLARELAASLYHARDYANALPMLEQLAAAEPAAADLQFFLGDALLRSEQAEKSLAYLRSAARLDPQLLPARASLGLALAQLGQAEEAVPHLEAALSIDDDGSLHYQLSRAYQRSGKAEQAKTALQEYQRLQKQSESEKRDLEEKIQITPP